MWQASAYGPAIVTNLLPQIWQVKSCNCFTQSPTFVLRTVRVTINWRFSGVSLPLGASPFAELSPDEASWTGTKSDVKNSSSRNRQILKPSRPSSSSISRLGKGRRTDIGTQLACQERVLCPDEHEPELHSNGFPLVPYFLRRTAGPQFVTRCPGHGHLRLCI
jgi:hypothetical protein